MIEGGWSTNYSTRVIHSALTVIDGDITGDGIDEGRVLTFSAAAGVEIITIVDGFTIQNGKGDVGAGIFASASDAGLVDIIASGNIIRNNQSTNSDAGIVAYAQHSGSNVQTTLLNNMIFGNEAVNGGGGIYAFSNGSSEVSLNLINNIITANVSADVGGGLRAHASNGSVTNVTAKNTIIWGNTATGGHDIAIRQDSGGHATVNASHSDIGDVLLMLMRLARIMTAVTTSMLIRYL
jgi:hypothetical protein